jgi:hypothetical protein
MWKKLALLTLLAGVGIGLSLSKRFFDGQLVQTYQDTVVSAGNVRYFFNALSAHSGKQHYLKVNGNVHKWVSGVEPYYINLPELHSILFVTREGFEPSVVHILDLKTLREIRVSGVLSFYGGHIGSKRAPGEDLTDYVEQVGGDKIVLASRSGNTIIRTVLNLASQKVDSVEDVRLPGDSGK